MENQIYGDILIRNIDASYLYWKGYAEDTT